MNLRRRKAPGTAALTSSRSGGFGRNGPKRDDGAKGAEGRERAGRWREPS
jgi:hypothetical protein